MMLLTSLFLICLASVVARASDPVPFDGNSFSISATIRVENGQEAPVLVKSHEMYSMEDKRAKITFENLIENQSSQLKSQIRTYVYDGNENLGLMSDHELMNCQKVKVEEFQRLFGLDKILGPPAGNDKYSFVIGPAALLFKVTRHLDTINAEKTEVMEHNMPAYSLSYDYSLDGTNKMSVLVIYSESEFSSIDNKLSKTKIPLRIRVVPADNFQIMAEFTYSIPEMIVDTSSLGHRRYENVLVDPFTFPLNFGCSEFIQMVSPIGGGASSFSFRSMNEQISLSNGPDRYKPNRFNSFVAYNSLIKSLRFDRSYTAGVTGTRRQIYNFKQNRLYHMVAKEADSDTTIDKILNLRDEFANNNEARTDKIQCIVAKLLSQYSPTPSMGMLLLGAEKFSYMGRAFIRGIRAKIFETQFGKSPYWFDAPIEYKDSNDYIYKLRLPESDLMNGDEDHLNSIVYISDDSQQKLLLIELYRVNRTTKEGFEKKILFIYDFNWALDMESPNGDKAADLFSLCDYCSSNTGRNMYTKFSMNLESTQSELKTDFVSSSLKVANWRNQALLGAIQNDMQIPPTMVYDLESRMLTSRIGLANGQEQERELITSTFRVSQHTNFLVEIQYLGQGRLKRAEGFLSKVKPCRSFQACFFGAAHLKFNSFFAYNPRRLECFLDLKAARDYGNDTSFGPFVEMSNGFLEVYRTNHRLDPLKSWLYKSPSRADVSRIYGKLMTLYSPLMSSKEFRITQIKIGDDDLRQRANKYQNTPTLKPPNNLELDQANLIPEDDSDDMSTIPGYGFILEDQENQAIGLLVRSIEPARVSSNFETEMNHDQCQAACLSNFECQAYSVCVANYRTKCLVANSQIIVPDDQQTFKQEAGEIKRGMKVKFKLDSGDSINLIRDKNCVIYNKRYVELFGRERSYSMDLKFRDVYLSTNGVNDCAKICLKQNLLVLTMDSSDTKSKLEKLSNDNYSDDDLLNLRKRHLDAIESRTCERFHYLDEDGYEGLSDKTKLQFKNRALNSDSIKGQGSLDDVNGYCIIDKKFNEKENVPQSEVGQFEMFRVANYYFKYELFYEKRYGVRLLESEMSLKEEKAFKLLLSGPVKQRELVESPETFQLIKDFSKQKRNFVVREFGYETGCASRCFRQKTPSWPACKSFSIVTEFSSDSVNTVCFYNTITSQEAEANGATQKLVDYNSNLTVWFYEPRQGFAFDESNLEAKFTEFYEENLLKNQIQNGTYRFYLAGTLVLMLMGMICGILLGIQTGKRFFGDSLPRTESLTEDLITNETQKSVRFNLG